MIKGQARQIIGDGVLSGVIQRDVPSPRSGELLLGVHATSINFHDLIGIDGGIPGLPVPRVPFSDASATVLEVGAGVEGFAAGDRVIPCFFLKWERGPVDAGLMQPVLGDQVDGALQTHVCVPARAVVHSPANLTHEDIATLGCAGLTAWRSVVEEAQIRPGQTVLLQGTGGVSLAALAFARMQGARVIITSSSDEKLERARALGAHETINYRDQPDWHTAVLDMTDGKGVDAVVEVAGGETVGKAIQATRVGGHVSVIGVLTGFESATFPLALVMQRNLTVRGVTVGSREHLDAMCRAIEINGYDPVIDSIYDLGTADDAIAHVRGQSHFGKVVIRVGKD
ncbi:zinc-binding dehydrogenase [Novosphingobium sp. FGD1]|uniref:Zinc-binding dehydrogenase n=1 Tax=Novosphingobium silvae TaxID=2692619 RepID=A0A7X4GD24_9SPHN|nr:zinc-binding dehydrogenase [Novosphingobium silvae]